MKKFVLFLCLSLVTFYGAYTLSQLLPLKVKETSGELVAYAPASYVLKNRPFTVVIVGYNNAAFVEKTLSSVFSQSYDNFRVIYIDDASDDGSFEVARDIIYESDYLTYVTLVKNETHLGNLANIYRAVLALPDEEIVVPLNGEDWLAHEWVLQRFNAYFDDPSLWIAQSASINYPSYQLATGANSCFYAALFKKIKEVDLIYSGNFLKTCAELAYMTPMLEMGNDHFHFIPEVLFVNNQEKTKDEIHELDLAAEKYIRSIAPYSPLKTLEVSACCD